MNQSLIKPKVVLLESISERLERFLVHRDSKPNFIRRNILNYKNDNVIAVLDHSIPEENEVERSYHFGDKMIVAPKLSFLNKLEFMFKPEVSLSVKLAELKRNPDKLKQWFIGKNEVTNDGEIGYANQAATESPSANEDFFGTAASRMQLANPSSTNSLAAGDTWAEFDGTADSISGSNKVFDTAFPKRNDGDADNTGAGVDIVSFLTSYTTGDFNDGGVTIKNFAILDNASPTDPTKLLTHGGITAFNKTGTDTLKFFINHEMRRV